MSLATREAGELQSAPGLPLGPESLTWQLFADHRMALLGPRAAVLQNMLPALGQGVEDHSVWFAETLARLARSIPPIFGTVYGPDPEATGRRVRDFHTSIKGTMPDGRPYSALNPETYYWAHATFVEHLVVATETFIRPLGPRGEGPDHRGVGDLVRAVRRQRARHPDHLGRVRGLLGRRARASPGPAPHRGVRRRLCHQGLAPPRPRASSAVVARPAPGRRDQLVAHHRWPAAAGPRDPRPALGRRTASAATVGSPGWCEPSTRCVRRLPPRMRLHPIAARAFAREASR